MLEGEYIIVTTTKIKYRHFQGTQCSLTNTAAIPMPVPMHILVTNIRLFVCLAMFRPVATWRAPAI